MIDPFPPAFLFFLAAIVLPIIPQGRLRAALACIVPILAAMQVWGLEPGSGGHAELFGFTLELMRVDKLSIIFGLIFCLAAFLGNLFAFHVRDTIQQVAALFMQVLQLVRFS